MQVHKKFLFVPSTVPCDRSAFLNKIFKTYMVWWKANFCFRCCFVDVKFRKTIETAGLTLLFNSIIFSLSIRQIEKSSYIYILRNLCIVWNDFFLSYRDIKLKYNGNISQTISEMCQSINCPSDRCYYCNPKQPLSWFFLKSWRAFSASLKMAITRSTKLVC